MMTVPSLRVPRLIAAAIALSALASQAEVNGAMPEALKGVAQAGASCQRDDLAKPAAAGTSMPAHAAGPSADLSCAASVVELTALQRRQSLTWVDTRAAADYQHAHVDGAMNASPSSLRGKRYLRDRTVVLIGSGKAEESLYEACAALKADGFPSVKVLRGGMPMWLAQGQSAVGQGLGEGNPPSLSSSELWLESQFGANVVLVADSHAAVNQQLPYAMPLKQANAASVVAVLERRKREMKQAPLHAVVVVAAESALPDELRRSMAATLRPVPLLVYTATADTFLRDMRQQQLTWRAQARGPKLPPCGR
ncbi:MAG: rhodanese-like domain-containing protein [Burkholderiaceae bacterium]